MFNIFKKREEFKPKVKTIDDQRVENLLLLEEVSDLKLQALMRKVAEQEILIRRLLDLVVMNIEHKDYSKYLLPKITQIQNLLDKK
jgi:hypothetical protein